MKNIYKKVFISSIISLFLIQMIGLSVEPKIAIADSAPDDVVVTLNVSAGIAISNGADATMTPNIGLTSDKSVGSSSWNVKTSSATGYSLSVKASTTPALVNGSIDSFNDYTEAPFGTPDTWGGVASGDKEFGYSAYGTDVLASFGAASSCGNISNGTPDAAAKYLGFSTADIEIATSNAVTPLAGTDTNICFAAEQNGTYAASGAYTATITATATTI